MATKKSMKNETVGLSAPWYIFADTLNALFDNDKEVSIIIPKTEKDGTFTVTIKSGNTAKLAAIKKLVGESRVFGNITVVVEYSDTSECSITAKDIEEAFEGNEYYIKTVEGETPYGTYDFPIVAKEVVQFYIDDLTDGYGNANMVVADAIRSILDPDKQLRNIAITTANGTED